MVPKRRARSVEEVRKLMAGVDMPAVLATAVYEPAMDIDQLAHDMYDRYGDSAGWKNYAGLAMPTWETLPEAIRTHWKAVAEFAFKTINKASVPRG